jgi:hypothetical protein
MKATKKATLRQLLDAAGCSCYSEDYEPDVDGAYHSADCRMSLKDKELRRSAAEGETLKRQHRIVLVHVKPGGESELMLDKIANNLNFQMDQDIFRPDVTSFAGEKKQPTTLVLGGTITIRWS